MGTQASQAAASAPDRQRYPLARGIEILTLMTDGAEQSYGVRELAGRLGVSASTAHRLLSDLEELGMVSRTPAGSYRLHVFHERATEQTLDELVRTVEVSGDQVQLPPISVSESGYLQVPHKNKFGKEYPVAPGAGGYPGQRP